MAHIEGLDQPYAAKTCPHPGCDKIIRARGLACWEHTDWSRHVLQPEDYALVRDCRGCGQEFQITSSRNYYCLDCRSFECPVCGSTFTQSPSDGRVTCSDKCSDFHNNAPILTCKYCGQEFKQRDGKPTQTCGKKECRYGIARKYPDGNGPSRRSWEYKRWRRKVFKRDDYTCQHCGATEKLHAHHTKSWDKHPELAYIVGNGLTLCLACHIKEHGGKHIRNKGTDRIGCTDCNAAITGTGNSPYCRSCAMKRAYKRNPSAWKKKS